MPGAAPPAGGPAGGAPAGEPKDAGAGAGGEGNEPQSLTEEEYNKLLWDEKQNYEWDGEKYVKKKAE